MLGASHVVGVTVLGNLNFKFQVLRDIFDIMVLVVLVGDIRVKRRNRRHSVAKPSISGEGKERIVSYHRTKKLVKFERYKKALTAQCRPDDLEALCIH